jgi:hypothetical protein
VKGRVGQHKLSHNIVQLGPIIGVRCHNNPGFWLALNLVVKKAIGRVAAGLEFSPDLDPDFYVQTFDVESDDTGTDSLRVVRIDSRKCHPFWLEITYRGTPA